MKKPNPHNSEKFIGEQYMRIRLRRSRALDQAKKGVGFVVKKKKGLRLYGEMDMEVVGAIREHKIRVLFGRGRGRA